MKVKYQTANGLSATLDARQAELVQIHVAFREGRAVLVFDGVAPVEVLVDRDLPGLSLLAIRAAEHAGVRRVACAVRADFTADPPKKPSFLDKAWNWLKGSKP